MSKCFKPLGLAVLCAVFLLAYRADTQGQDKGAADKGQPDKAAESLTQASAALRALDMQLWLAPAEVELQALNVAVAPPSGSFPPRG